LADENKYVLDGKKRLKEKLKAKVIQDSNYREELKKLQADKKALKVLVKADDLATCKNFIDLIDELRIHDIGAMAPVEMMPEETELVKAKTK